MTKTESLPMVQCTSCSKEIQLSVYENHMQQCAPSQRQSKITGHFPAVSEKSSLFTSLQGTFPDKPLEYLEKVAAKSLDIQQAVEEVLAAETEYDGIMYNHPMIVAEKLLLPILIIKVNLKPISKK